MRAVTFSRFGGPEVLEVSDLPEPRPGPGEVRIRVAAATVNPTDIGLREGMRREMLEAFPPPWIPGMELAGEIDAVGPGGDWQVGRPVMAIALPLRALGGAQAEQVVVPAASVAEIPAGATLEQAATLPMNGLTVRLALDTLALARGEKVKMPPVLYLQGTADIAHPVPNRDAFIASYRKAGGRVENVTAKVVSGNYYRALGAHAEIGRTISDDDDRDSTQYPVVLSHSFWQRALGGRANALGETIRLRGVAMAYRRRKLVCARKLAAAVNHSYALSVSMRCISPSGMQRFFGGRCVGSR